MLYNHKGNSLFHEDIEFSKSSNASSSRTPAKSQK